MVSQILHTGETSPALPFVMRMHIVGSLCAHAVVTPSVARMQSADSIRTLHEVVCWLLMTRLQAFVITPLP